VLCDEDIRIFRPIQRQLEADSRTQIGQGKNVIRVKTLSRIYKQVGSLEQELEFKYFGVEQESLFSSTSTLGDPMFATLNTKAKMDVRVR
jgi:hypothetical protein